MRERERARESGTISQMGTREVYEQKLRAGNLYHDPTIKPGLGTPRCPRCLSLLNPDSVLHALSLFSANYVFKYVYLRLLTLMCLFLLMQKNGEWTITSVLHDATAVVSYPSFFSNSPLVSIFVCLHLGGDIFRVSPEFWC